MKTVTCMLPSQFILTVVLEIEKSGVKPTLHCWVFWYCQARDSAPTSASAHNFDKKYCVNIFSLSCPAHGRDIACRLEWRLGDSETQRWQIGFIGPWHRVQWDAGWTFCINMEREIGNVIRVTEYFQSWRIVL